MVLTKTQASNMAIQVWERLHLAIGEPGKEGIYNCRVSDLGQGMLIISRPEYQYGDSLLANNRIVSARFTRADAAYSFRARLVETEPPSDDAMLLVDLGKVERLQRRRFVRLDMVFAAEYKFLYKPIEEPIEMTGKGFHSCRSINISAGGMLIQSKTEIRTNALVLFHCSDSGLDNLPKYLVAVCRQVRRDDKGNILAGFEFILAEDMSKYLSKREIQNIPTRARSFNDKSQNALVTELFTEQLVMRQKGIL